VFAVPSPSRRPPNKSEDSGSNVPLLLAGAGILVVVLILWLFLGGSRAAEVSGKVTLDEQPVTLAELVFVGEDERNRAPLVAVTNDAGDYRLIGHKDDGIAPGWYKVTVRKMALKDGSVPKGDALAYAQQEELLQNVLPKKYEDGATTPLRFEVRSGNNTINLPLTKNP
jgi:hypothetical protein